MVVSLVIGLSALVLANLASSERLQIVDFAVLAICLLSFIGAFYYFMFYDRESLRSERHAQVTRVLDITEAKGNVVDFDPVDLIERSEPRQLPGPSDEE